MIAIVIVYSV